MLSGVPLNAQKSVDIKKAKLKNCKCKPIKKIRTTVKKNPYSMNN